MSEMGRAPFVPPELTKAPFDSAEARRAGLSKDQLRGATWRRLGPGLYAWREIADQPLVQLQAAMRRLPSDAVFSGRPAAWLHGLDQQPCSPVEAICLRTAHLSGLAIRRCRLRPDYYPDKRLVIEYDGATHRDSLAANNRRQNRLINAGFKILRFAASDLKSDAAAIVRRALS
jgi:uncharacterized protein DUF559